MKALIIDDEKKARNVLKLLLEDCQPAVEILGEAENLPSGLRLIRELSPDIVFLDIEMPGYSGLQLLDFLTPSEVNFELVFTTAYSDHAIKAFEMNAVDYLLKPLQDEQVQRAVTKVASRRTSSPPMAERLETLAIALRQDDSPKIGLPLADGQLFVEVADLILLRAERMYTRVFTQQDGEILVSKPLKYFLDKLAGRGTFFQTHRSFLVNLKHVKRFSTQDGGYIQMENGEVANLSKEKREEFLSLVAM